MPGGQAVQRADDTVAVRNAAVVFCCDGTTRASVTASWYRQMGFPEVFAVDGGTTAWTKAGLGLVGQTIKFTLPGGATLCTATTNLNGTATCPSNLVYTVAMILAGRYNATFAGKDVYHGSTASASLIG